MGNISIILPKSLSDKIREKAEEMDLLPEELAVEVMLKGLGEELDPEKLAEHYQALSDKYFEESKAFLSKGDVTQASEKLWGAAALAVKSVAGKEGLSLKEHGSLWDFVSKLSKRHADRELVTLFSAANGLHRNFYEDQMDRESVEIVSEDIEKLIAKLRRLQ